MKKATQVLLLLLVAVSTFAQVTLNDVTLPARIKKDNTELILNGGGIRKKFVFKVYVAGLYLPAKSKNAADICGADKATGIRLVITSSVINSDNMSESINEGFGKSLNGNTTALRPKIDAFINTFKKEVIKEGDVFEVIYVPGEGVKSYKNEKYISTVAGLDFKKALFGIWLSENPVDADLKTSLLGQ
ncbi:MAG: chalcone isomerase family protein [Bacteroidetes bacterium]|nr:chalcone isomerase family protein [Bacteroidota bacterium]MBK8659767.1 chalcone isomerase family protein [Bacteroidota bacterium]